MTNISIEEQIDLMKRFKLNGNQWFLCQILWLCQQEGGSKYLYKYFEEVNRDCVIPMQDIETLVDNGVVEPFDYRNRFYYDTIVFTPKFRDKLLIDFNDAGRELWDRFPSERSYRIDGKKLMTKKIGSEFNSIEDFYKYYAKSIKYSKAIHDEVLKGLQIAIDTNSIDFTIVDFVKNKMWESFKEEAKGNVRVY